MIDSMRERRVVLAAMVAGAFVFVPPSALVAAVTTADWSSSADRICRRADRALFSALDRHDLPEVAAAVGDLERRERTELLAAMKITERAASTTARKLAKLRSTRAELDAVRQVVKALRHSANEQGHAVQEVRSRSFDPDLLVADTSPPDETMAVGIDHTGQLGAHECGRLLGDLLWQRDPSLLEPASPDELAALVVPAGPAGFVPYRGPDAGVLDIDREAADQADAEHSAADVKADLAGIGFNLGFLAYFDKPDTPDSFSVYVREFADPAGAAQVLRSERELTDGTYEARDIPSAWGYEITNQDSTVSRFVAFRVDHRIFYVGLTGATAYTEDELLPLAIEQHERASAPPPADTEPANTPEDAIGAALEAAGYTYAGDCAAADPEAVGSYCSLLQEDHGDSRVYGIGPVASEVTDQVSVTLEDGQWVVVD